MNCSSYEVQAQVDLYDSAKLKRIEQAVFDAWLPKESQSILDVGCGVGRTTVNLHKAGHKVIGIDYAPAMIERAKKRFPEIDFRVMNACNLDFPDNHFDLVLFSFNGIDCLYPLERRWEALQEVYRVLKPGGLFIMSSHNIIEIPKNKYGLFWWFINVVTGRIFTSYRLEYKGFKQGVKFIYCARRPKVQIQDAARYGFTFLDIFANPRRRWFQGLMKKTKNLFLITLLDSWPYYVYRK